MPHKLSAKHLEEIARAIAGVVMPRESRRDLVRQVCDVLEVTTPTDKAGTLKPESAFTARKRRAFEERSEPDKRLEIVAHVAMSADGREVLHQDWALHVWEGHWGHLTVRRPQDNSFAGAVALACDEYFVRDLSKVPIRFEK